MCIRETLSEAVNGLDKYCLPGICVQSGYILTPSDMDI